MNMDPKKQLVVATTNEGKVRELRELLSELPLVLRSMVDVLGKKIEVVEDAPTFEGNAEKKALELMRATGLPSLADDSGLEVDVLGGAPGVYSARYAGEHATDEDNRKKLLQAIAAAGPPVKARFRCVLAFANPLGPDRFDVKWVDGVCEGQIVRVPKGEHGFGYDPVFVPAGFDQTMAELSSDVKNRISHRGDAFRKMKPILELFARLSPKA